MEFPYKKGIEPKRNSFHRYEQAYHLEKTGYIDNAIELYESIVHRKFDAPASYDRLAIIYRKKKEYQREINVIDKLIKMLETNIATPNFDEKLIKAKERKKKAQELLYKK